MKGIIIYSNPMWGDNAGATYCDYINNASFELTQYAPNEAISCLKGEASESSKAVCSKDDTYDFETGALIALMKMCGVDKVVRACNEAFSEDTFKTYATMYERELNTLKKDFDKVRDLKDFYKKNYNERLEENKELKKNIDELFESEQHSKSELGRLYFEKHRLEEKVEKLKLDCEKLQHGYVDPDKASPCPADWDGDTLNILFLPGRACGKQYTALVELFKKIDQKKVDEAYKEAYNTTLPLWQKEALRQAYEIRIESKEKPDLPRTLDINGTTYRKSIQIRDFGEQINKLTVDSLIEQSRVFTRKRVDEWFYKIPTKREEKWERILELHKENDVIIEVKKEDIITFLHEIENRIPEIKWASWQKIFEAKGTIKDIYGALKTCNRIYFRLRKEKELSYSSDPHIYRYRDLEHISYLPPMRWDLFKKGRLAVKVTPDNYKEFYEACEKELGKRPVTAVFTEDFTVSICKKDGLFEIFTVEDQKKTGKKIVDWEDVR